MGAIRRDILQREVSYLKHLVTFSCSSFRQLRAIATMASSCTFMQRRTKTIRSVGQPTDNAMTPPVEIASHRPFIAFKSIFTSRKHVPAAITRDLSVTSHSLRSIYLMPEKINDATLRSDTSPQVKRCDVTTTKHC